MFCYWIFYVDAKFSWSFHSCETFSEDVAKFLIHELKDKFSKCDLMLTLEVMYFNDVEMFSTNIWLSSRLPILCLTRWESVFAKVLLNAHLLGVHLFKKRWQWLQIMKQSWKKILLWILSFNFGSKINSSSISIKHKLLKFIKLVEITCV